MLHALKYMLVYTSSNAAGGTNFAGISIQKHSKCSWDYAYDTRWCIGWDAVESWALYYWDNYSPYPISGWSVGRWGSDSDYSKSEFGWSYEFINASLNQGWAIVTITPVSAYLRPSFSGALIPGSPGVSTGDVYTTFGDDLLATDYWTNGIHQMKFGLDTNDISEPPGFPSGKPPVGWGSAPMPDWGGQTYSMGYKASYKILVDLCTPDTNARYNQKLWIKGKRAYPSL